MMAGRFAPPLVSMAEPFEATFGTIERTPTPYDRVQAVREAVSLLGGKPDILDVLRIAEYIATGEDLLKGGDE